MFINTLCHRRDQTFCMEYCSSCFHPIGGGWLDFAQANIVPSDVPDTIITTLFHPWGHAQKATTTMTTFRRRIALVLLAAAWWTDVAGAFSFSGSSAVRRRAKEAVASFGLALCIVLNPSAAPAIENPAEVGRCVLTQCQLPLLKCLGNPKCAANLVCLQTCSGRADEIDCQIRCGDLFENEIVGEFNACAVSQKKCVPRREDDGSFPVPPTESLVKKFDTKTFEGRWYISAGLNPIFDTFDCQVHFFTTNPGKVYGKLNWRIEEPDGEFFTKDTVQRFAQAPSTPALLRNTDNEYLHYEDDWYVLDSQAGNDESAFVLVYYRGRNDAWDGYGGAVLYTRTPYPSPQVVERARTACDKTNIFKWEDMTIPDNTCGPKVTGTKALLLKEKYASKVFLTAEKELQEEATNLRRNAVDIAANDVKEVVQATAKLEKAVQDYEKLLEDDLKVAEESAEKAIEKAESILIKK